MNAEFNWWLLIVGLVGGAGLLWLVLGDFSRREEEVDAEERSRESTWIAEVLAADGMAVDPVTAEEVLRLHRLYLRHSRRIDPGEADELPAGDETADGSVALDRPIVADEVHWVTAEPRGAIEGQPGPDRSSSFDSPTRRNPLVED